MAYIGIDPGVNGGIVAIHDDAINTLQFKAATEKEINGWLYDNAWEQGGFAYIEKVHSSPQMGVVSAFTFGKSYGFLRGALHGVGIAFDEVSPQKWQRELGCLSKGDKNVTKAKAQQLFPTVKVTHAIADALLIAEYCRRVRR